MTTAIDVANLALDNIGARFSITSISPPGPVGNPNALLVARQYQPRVDSVFRAAHWNCARVQNDLTLLYAANGTPENPDGTTLPLPNIPYQYGYAYPSDCLAARYLIANPPNGGNASPPILAAGFFATPNFLASYEGFKFEVGIITNGLGAQIKVIWTNLEFAQLVYTARILDPDLWDSHFLNAVAAYLGSWWVNPLAPNPQTLKQQIDIASAIIQQARISDGDEGVTSADHTPDFLAVRGTSIDGGGIACAWYGWQGIGFPGGIWV